jgi:hypothetical protein
MLADKNGPAAHGPTSFLFIHPHPKILQVWKVCSNSVWERAVAKMVSGSPLFDQEKEGRSLIFVLADVR